MSLPIFPRDTYPNWRRSEPEEVPTGGCLNWRRSQLEYLIALIFIIVGLGVTDLAQSVRELVRPSRPTPRPRQEDCMLKSLEECSR
jgi:hypothetical protein